MTKTDAIAERPAINSPLRERYQLFRMVGTDEIADVFLARDLADDTPVRVRNLRPETIQPDQLPQVLRGLKAALEWRHPAALPLREVGISEGRLYVVTERPRGGALIERLTSDPSKISLARAAAIVDDALSVVEAAVVASIPHPGISPNNVFVNPFGAVEVGDFGLPAILPTGLSQDAIAPSMYVRAPESGAGPSSIAEQLYAAAALLIWLVGGKPPFGGSSAADVMRRHRSRLAPSLATIDATAPEQLVTILARCLRKDPTGRPATIAALRAALAPLIDSAGLRDTAGSNSHGTEAAGDPSGRRFATVVESATQILLPIKALWQRTQSVRSDESETPDDASRHVD